MISRKCYVPLLDLRLQHNSIDAKKLFELKDWELTSNKTYPELSETGKENINKKLQRSQEEDNVDEDQDYDTTEENDVGEDGDYDITEENDVGEDQDYDITEENDVGEDQDYDITEEDNVHEDRDFGTTSKLSAYEKMIQKNRREKMAILQALKIEEAKLELYQLRPAKKKCIKRKFSPQVLRKSKRLEDALMTTNKEKVVKSKKIALPERTFKEALDREDRYESYVVDVNIQETNSVAKWMMYDKSVLEKMTVSKSNTAKLGRVHSSIVSAAWYPSPEHLILTVGDNLGFLGIWNVDSESSPYIMKTYPGKTTNLQFNPFNQVHLVSSIYNGLLFCGDMVQQKFYEIYNISDKTRCTYFDILSASTYLVAQVNGQVALVDRRKSLQKKYTCHEAHIKTVNIHPVNRNLFVTADKKGFIRLWDLRMVQKHPVADIDYKRCVYSAYFSPVTGNSLLVTSIDKSISIFDSTNLYSEIKLKQKMNHGDERITLWRATWLPNSEETFAIGSIPFPCGIGVFDKNMHVYNIMKHEHVKVQAPCIAFHPTRSAVACVSTGNSAFVFT